MPSLRSKGNFHVIYKLFRAVGKIIPSLFAGVRRVEDNYVIIMIVTLLLIRITYTIGSLFSVYGGEKMKLRKGVRSSYYDLN